MAEEAELEPLAVGANGHAHEENADAHNGGPNRETILNWNYANQKTWTQGALNLTLLTSTFVSLLKFCDIPEEERKGYWIPIIVIHTILIITEMATAALSIWRAPITPKTEGEETTARRMHNVIAILIYVNSVFHFMICIVEKYTF